MYKILGADQKEYGPVPSEKVREWIAQGRANAQTMISFEGGPWKPLSTFPEFADVLRTAVPPPLAQTTYVGGALKSNALSNWGLACSILGFCCLPLAIVGIICSAMGLAEINKNPQAYSTNKALPIIGLVLGICALGSVFFYFTGAFREMFGKFLPQ